MSWREQFTADRSAAAQIAALRDEIRSFRAHVEIHLVDLTERILTMSGTVADLKAATDSLTAEVASDTSIMQSAATMIDGIGAIVAEAVQQARAAGATQEQVQPITDAVSALAASRTALGNAVAANTQQAAATSQPPAPDAQPSPDAQPDPNQTPQP